MNDYLFEVPANFELSSLALVLAIVGCVSSVFLIWYYQKRREKGNLIVAQRRLMRLHAKINLGLMAGYLAYVISRIINIDFLSYRAVGYFFLVISLINIIIAGLRIIKSKSNSQLSMKIEGESNYGKYLPKKKKK